MNICNVCVERKDNSCLKITWNSEDPNQLITIYSGDSPDHIDYLNPIARVTYGNEFTVQDHTPDFRKYFSIISENNHEIVTAERLVHLEGTHNFRDLGGYKTQAGKYIKWGQIFRSDSLSKLTNRDQRLLTRLGLKTVCDFRSKAEMEWAPDKLPDDGSVAYLHLPVSSHNFDTLSALERLQKGDAEWLTESFMREGYITNIDQYAQTWGTVMNYLSLSENRPLVFHCTAGKDRTGTCAAILLLLLGVPEETIIQDHGLSNFFLANFLEKLFAYFKTYGIEREKIYPYLTAPKDAIISLLNHIRKKYGSSENYLIKMTGINPETIGCLRKDLLE
jgi:protein-tyrosine phosphatase